jgi:hypothetical protein
MITYELAKQLKDAGFPQHEDHMVCEVHDCFYGIPHEGHPCAPSLEELIEACGDSLHSIEHWVEEGEGWTAFPMSSMQKCAEGATPTEAVARLWLALNSK